VLTCGCVLLVVRAQRYEQLEKAKVEQDTLLVEMRTQIRDYEAGPPSL
jgi:hypothetical protein